MLRIIIAAVAENGCIGAGNGLPWRLPEDLRMFMRETTGHALVMGRKTFETLNKPLPNRLNIVVSRTSRESDVESVVYVTSLDEAWRACGDREKVFIAGGAEIYRIALPVVDEMWLTRVFGEYEGDTFFPDYPPGQEWIKYHDEPGDGLRFERYRRVAR